MRQFRVAVNFTNRQEANLDKYLADINRYPLLKIAEEVELGERSRNGDLKARQQLVNSNLRFVVTVAKQYGNKFLSLQDLINEGNIWLLRAAEKFDPTRWFKFISYAVWRIRQSIMAALGEHSEIIKRTTPVNTSIKAIKDTNDFFVQHYERDATVEELADVLELSVSKIKDTLSHASISVSSYDLPLNDDSDSSSLVDLFMASDTTDKAVDVSIIQNSLQYAMYQLSWAQRQVIEFRFWFNDMWSSYTYSQVADMMWTSVPIIKRIERKAFITMKKFLAQTAISKDIISVLES